MNLQKSLTNSKGDVYLEIETDEKEGLIYAKWKGKTSLDEIKTGSLAYLDVLKECPCSKLISDNTELETSWQPLNDWVEHTWTPRALALNLQYFALVVSPVFFVKVAAVELSQRIGDQLEIKTFNNLATARKWLSEVQ